MAEMAHYNYRHQAYLPCHSLAELCPPPITTACCGTRHEQADFLEMVGTTPVNRCGIRDAFVLEYSLCGKPTRRSFPIALLNFLPTALKSFGQVSLPT